MDIKALFLTIILELIVLLFFIKKYQKTIIWIMLLSIVINFLTNVPLNLFIKYYLFGMNPIIYMIIVIILEVLIVFIEGFSYNIIIRKYKKSLFVSLICNLISFILGSFIYNMILV